MTWYDILCVCVAGGCIILAVANLAILSKTGSSIFSMKWGNRRHDGAILINDNASEFPWQVHIDIPLDEIKNRDVLTLKVINQDVKELERIKEKEEEITWNRE